MAVEPEEIADSSEDEDSVDNVRSASEHAAADSDRVEENRERRRHHKTIISAWRQQQTQDRAMRRTYARWLMTVLSVQLVVIHVLFLLIGCRLLSFEPWTANVFIAAVFAEISAMVLLVVKYLFPATTDKILDLIDRFKGRDGLADGGAGSRARRSSRRR
jgi:hypothetical protein